MANTRAKTSTVFMKITVKDADTCGMYCSFKKEECQSFSFAGGKCWTSTSNDLEAGTEARDGFEHYWRSTTCPE
jgi:hypothetical protein